MRKVCNLLFLISNCTNLGSPKQNLPVFPRVETMDCGDEAASWLSDLLGQPCRLIRQSPDFTRYMNKKPDTGKCVHIFALLHIATSQMLSSF